MKNICTLCLHFKFYEKMLLNRKHANYSKNNNGDNGNNDDDGDYVEL